MNFKLISRISIRNFSRNRRRTVLLLLGLALANTMIIWMLTFRQRSYDTMLDQILAMKMGREELAHPTYFDFEKKRTFPHKTFDKEAAAHLMDPAHPAAFRVETFLMLAGNQSTVPVKLSGYDWSRELQHSGLRHQLKEFTFRSQWPLVLGTHLANRLGVKLGDEVAVIGQALDGSVANELFTVEGLMDLGGGEFEATFAVTSLEVLQDFIGMPRDRAHLLVNYSPMSLSSLGDKLGLSTHGWIKFLPNIANGARFMDNFTRFYAFFFAVVASLAMGNTLALSFLERLPEYRALTLIGTPRRWLRASMFIEGLYLGCIALVLGNLCILFVITVFYFFPLDLSLLTGGEVFRMGGMVVDQKVVLKPIGRVFLVANSLFIITMGLASLFPIRLVLNRAQAEAG